MYVRFTRVCYGWHGKRVLLGSLGSPLSASNVRHAVFRLRSLLCVCAAAGLGRVAREHLAVAVALEVPVAVIITKVRRVERGPCLSRAQSTGLVLHPAATDAAVPYG